MPPAVADSPAAAEAAFAAGLEEETGTSAAPETEERREDAERADAATPPPSVLDRFLWAVVKDVDEEAVLGFFLTSAEYRRLTALTRKRERGRLSEEEELEHFDLKLTAECVPLLKVAIHQKRNGWRGEALAEPRDDRGADGAEPEHAP